MEAELLPRPPGLDAGAEAWDAFMDTQHETMRTAIRAEEQVRSQGVVTRTGLRKQNAALYDFRRRLMLSATKNEFKYKGCVIDAKSGSALRTYICEWEDIPETLSGISAQKEYFAKEGDQITAEWLGFVEKAFALKRRQWFEDGCFHIYFDDPIDIEVDIYSRCLQLAEDEASRWKDDSDVEKSDLLCAQAVG